MEKEIMNGQNNGATSAKKEGMIRHINIKDIENALGWDKVIELGNGVSLQYDSGDKILDIGVSLFKDMNVVDSFFIGDFTYDCDSYYQLFFGDFDYDYMIEDINRSIDELNEKDFV